MLRENEALLHLFLFADRAEQEGTTPEASGMTPEALGMTANGLGIVPKALGIISKASGRAGRGSRECFSGVAGRSLPETGACQA